MLIDTVREIVGTYELSDKFREKIIFRATNYLKKRGFASIDWGVYNNGHYKHFSTMYRLIDKLIENSHSRKESISINLDSLLDDPEDLPLDPDLKGQYREAVGFEDPNFRKIESENSRNNLTLNEAIKLLKGRIDGSSLEFLLKLQNYNGNGDMKLELTREEVIANAGKIQNRIGVWARKYGRNDSISMPSRPIVYIAFEPYFSIKFGRRNYYGNPLAYVQDHSDRYEGIRNPTEFKAIDPGLAISLWKHKQMDSVIPSNRRRYSQEVIISVYNMANGNYSEAARILGCAPIIVWRKLKAAGLVAKGGKGGRPANEKSKEIFALYPECNRNVSEIARRLGLERTVVAYHLKKRGLKGLGRNKS